MSNPGDIKQNASRHVREAMLILQDFPTRPKRRVCAVSAFVIGNSIYFITND